MSEAIAISYEEWRENRSQLVKIGGITARIKYVSNQLLENLSADTDLDQILSAIEHAPMVEAVEHTYGRDNRRMKATKMRNALEIILPHVLVSPDWLTQALNDFTDDEIYRLYNFIMHVRVKN